MQITYEKQKRRLSPKRTRPALASVVKKWKRKNAILLRIAGALLYRNCACNRRRVIVSCEAHARVMELADVTDSKYVGLITRAGSTPATGTTRDRPAGGGPSWFRRRVSSGSPPQASGRPNAKREEVPLGHSTPATGTTSERTAYRSLRPFSKVRAYSFRRSSFQNATRFAGLAFCF